MLTNLQHWQSFYQASESPTFPSQFSVFVQSWLVKSTETIIEVGCGNGRDAIFLNRAGHKVLVTDQVVGPELRELADTSAGFDFVEGDVVAAIGELGEYVDLTNPVVIYSRFFQHAIPEEVEMRMLNALHGVLAEGSRLFFEFRLDEDKDKPKAFGVDHYRRFQSAESFIGRLEDAGFECVYHCKGTGYARYGEEDPVVGRFVAQTKARSPRLQVV